MASGTLNKVNGFIRISASTTVGSAIAYANSIIRLVILDINSTTGSGTYNIIFDEDYKSISASYAALRGGNSYVNIAVGSNVALVVEAPAWAVGLLIFLY